MNKFSWLLWLLVPISLSGQNSFDPEAYHQFLEQHQNLSADALQNEYPLPFKYYAASDSSISLSQFAFFDSIQTAYTLTDDERLLLQQHHFVITERLSYPCFGRAFHDVYIHDLPVFVSTDAVLHALHASYDKLLMHTEIQRLIPNLDKILGGLYNTFPRLHAKYQNDSLLTTALEDVDLYVTIAKSLLDDKKHLPHLSVEEQLNILWDAIQAENMVQMPLFSEHQRKLDFSQFTVRGHYTGTYWDGFQEKSMAPYFKAMMWLGRIDFLLTAPPKNPWEEPWSKTDIQRMTTGAVLIHELINMAGMRSLLDENDAIITFWVGESDNLTLSELSNVIDDFGLTSANALYDSTVFDTFQTLLRTNPDYAQRILSNFYLMNPFANQPDTLPISFRLLGQRFIIDSYIFSNVVYDRIIYNNQKIWRPMPDPLDAMFVLGNNNAMHLVKEELNRYHYASQLAALRYLVDSYNTNFWSKSLYNTWLQSIRSLKTVPDQSGRPFFMKTAAWQQEKLNTQLASWAQLRHDNLLYAKQSYTGGTGCSFPHSYIEPYPEFYDKIATFADQACAFFAQYQLRTNEIQSYFSRLKSITERLSALAEKELAGETFDANDQNFLQRMLFQEAGSGAPPFSGWYAELFYSLPDAAKIDYIIADVHTQPTDQFGNIVGKVLHVGVGPINLGVFLAPSPSDGYRPMAFVGPVMSYYETITDNFKRLTDEDWSDLVENNQLPVRPDWVNIYLTDNQGAAYSAGRKLPTRSQTQLVNDHPISGPQFAMLQNYPNPFNPATVIYFDIPERQAVTLTIHDILGREVARLLDHRMMYGHHQFRWDASQQASGVYICRLQAGKHTRTIKLMLMH